MGCALVEDISFNILPRNAYFICEGGIFNSEKLLQLRGGREWMIHRHGTAISQDAAAAVRYD